jgi:hypothetical protein
MNRKLFWKSSNAVGIGRRVLLMGGQRSGGKHLIGPIYYHTEWHDQRAYGVKPLYFNLTVGNPKVHTKWAFSIWVYVTL